MAISKRKVKLKAAIDANILFSGVIYPRFAFEVLNHAFKEDFILHLLPLTIEEAVRNVAKKIPSRLFCLERFLIKCPYQLLENPTLITLEKNQNLIRHHSDLPLAVAALQNHLDYIISNDKDFTGTDITTKAIQQKIDCITAGNFLKNVMGWTSEELADIQDKKFKNAADLFWDL